MFQDAFLHYSTDPQGKDLAFIPWAIQGGALMFTITGEKDYANWAFEMTDRLIRFQNKNPERMVYGSFFLNPNVFTASNLEGIGAAFKLSVALNDAEKTRKYRNSMLAGTSWILRHQITRDEVRQRKWTEYAAGGFKTTLTDHKIRIDNTQHAVSALIKAYETINY
jgi:hypothetical protein